jgi:putative hemolysin
MARNSALVILALVSCTATAACSHAESDRRTADATPPVSVQTQRVKLANPASRKCVDDGYVLQPIMGQEGTVSDYNCVDRKTGASCPEWDYFRGTCTLREVAPTPAQ